MAAGTGRKRTTAKRSTNTRKKKTRPTKQEEQQLAMWRHEILYLILIGFCLILFISNFGVGGMIGDSFSSFFFGLFGFMAYIFPIFFIFLLFFIGANIGNRLAIIKTVGLILLFFCICILMEMFTAKDRESIMDFFRESAKSKMGGGLISGLYCSLFYPALGKAGAYVLLIVLMIIGVVLVTGRSFINGVKSSSQRVVSTAKKDVERRREINTERQKQVVSLNKPKRSDKKVRGVAEDTQLTPPDEPLEDMREIKPKPGFYNFTIQRPEEEAAEEEVSSFEPIPHSYVEKPQMSTPDQIQEQLSNMAESGKTEIKKENTTECLFASEDEAAIHNESPDQHQENSDTDISKSYKASSAPKISYKFPPLTLLKKGKKNRNGDSDAHLRETAIKLQQTLASFGVEVTITNISCGPTITRYEIMPEQGVKVNRIVSLTDDIKLNLAATDIRIEAPIPGKSAVGIEVPNTTNNVVMFRDLLESEEYQNHPSKLAFATGKDIAGNVMITDIAKMPHLLIAGATGSGKSVCINTLIMSILFKASPDDVKLIMIDPKVVELSIYNGIPHLFIPVVTDPKKAAGALNWAVTEMTERYKKFADLNVRDIKGYNEKIESIKDIEDEEKPDKLPQIVIIVDELADLMMVSSKEVEEAICRLAQLARAAGLHLILATQRPSVNVVTGLIKANMPSKIAFSVTSGVDSRTILGMNGAEKLLGKGDMLFFPQDLPKPIRAQGAFISDQEVSKVVDFITKQYEGVRYDNEIQQKINNAPSSLAGESGSDSDLPDRDVLFSEAGKFIIEKDKASIGMLQRMFKIGFNRAARIMDQLAEAGIVGEEEGTKPRKVLMSMEEFEAYLDEFV